MLNYILWYVETNVSFKLYFNFKKNYGNSRNKYFWDLIIIKCITNFEIRRGIQALQRTIQWSCGSLRLSTVRPITTIIEGLLCFGEYFGTDPASLRRFSSSQYSFELLIVRYHLRVLRYPTNTHRIFLSRVWKFTHWTCDFVLLSTELKVSLCLLWSFVKY